MWFSYLCTVRNLISCHLSAVNDRFASSAIFLVKSEIQTFTILMNFIFECKVQNPTRKYFPVISIDSIPTIA